MRHYARTRRASARRAARDDADRVVARRAVVGVDRVVVVVVVGGVARACRVSWQVSNCQCT